MSDIRDDYLKFRVEEDKSSNSFMSLAIKTLVIVLLLLLLVILGAMAYKYLFKEDKAVSQTAPAQSQTNENTDVIQNVTKAVQNNGSGVKKEEVALIVKSVLAQMNQEKAQNKPSQPTTTTGDETTTSSTETTQQPEQNQGEDAALLSDLSSAEVDSVKDNDIDLSSLDNIDSNQKIQNNKKKEDTFNKVIIEEKKEEVATKDDLSKLYEKLNTIMKKDKTKVSNTDDSNYVSQIKQETKVRSNAMRIITIKRGDTLSLIAKRAYGNPMLYSKIFAANPDLIKNPNKIFPGQKLRVPK